jgi:cysteine desulfuration protein SufE
MKKWSFLEIKEQLGEQFSRLPSWEQRYQLMIQLGKEMELYPEEFRLEDFKVKGCQSQVWLHASWIPEDGTIKLRADSDALIVKGIIAILVKLYDQQTPKTILLNPPDFLKEWGITSHLSMGRSNGLVAMIKQIKLYALAFAKMDEK